MKVVGPDGEGNRKTVFLREVNGKLICESEDLKLTTTKELGRVLAALAELGYETAILDNTLASRCSVGEVRSLGELIDEVKSENSEFCGAIGVFIGFVRKISGEKEVVRLEYEAYEPVFSEKISEIERRLEEYPGVEGVKIFHRTGVLRPGEDIVYVVVMARHRKDLWKPLAESMEIVKRELPVWKKEVYRDGEVWVHDKQVQDKQLE